MVTSREVAQTSQDFVERAKNRRMGLITRLTSGRSFGDLYRDINQIEANFKAGGTREMAYPYETSKGRRMILVTPEDLIAVMNQRRTKLKIDVLR